MNQPTIAGVAAGANAGSGNAIIVSVLRSHNCGPAPGREAETHWSISTQWRATALANIRLVTAQCLGCGRQQTTKVSEANLIGQLLFTIMAIVAKLLRRPAVHAS